MEPTLERWHFKEGDEVRSGDGHKLGKVVALYPDVTRPTHLVAEERTLKASYLGSCVPAIDIPRIVGLYRAGRLPVDRLLTHRLDLEEINEGFDRLASGEAVRQAVVL